MKIVNMQGGFAGFGTSGQYHFHVEKIPLSFYKSINFSKDHFEHGGVWLENRLEKEQNITKQLRTVFKAIQAHGKVVESVCGLSSVRLWMLYEIYNAPGIKVSVLASLLSIHRSTCSNMLDKLEAKDLICRNRSKSDQRTVRLYITDEGKAVLSKAPSPPEGKLSSTLNKLSSEQIDDLEKSLGFLVDTLQYDDEKAAQTPIQTR